MSKKKVQAPLSYDPGKGRPQEYLAYLNWQEMQALMRLNGGNMEFGPRGLPSFPPDDALGSSSNSTTTSTNTNTTAGGTTNTSVGGDVGGESGGPGGMGSVQSSSDVGSVQSSPSYSAPSATYGGQNATDAAAQNSAVVKSAREAVSTPAIVDDARRGGINAINVGPMNQPVRIGDGKISQIVNQPAITVNAVEDFYKNDPVYQSAVQNLRRQSELARSAIVSRDSEAISRESPAYNFMTDSERNAIRDKFGSGPLEGIGKLASAAGDLASYVYNNPLDAAKGVVSSVLDPAARAGMYMVGDLPATDKYGRPTDRFVGDITEATLNYGVGAGIASLASRPKGPAVGAFMLARDSSAPEIKRALQYAEDKIQKYGPAQNLTKADIDAIKEDVYDQTSRMASREVSGVQYFQPRQDLSGLDPFGQATIEVAEEFRPKISGIAPGVAKKYTDVFHPGALEKFAPDVKEFNIIEDADALKEGTLGYFHPLKLDKPYGSTIPGVARYYYDSLRGVPSSVWGPGASFSSFDPDTLGRFQAGLTPEKLAKHEIGVHGMSGLSGGRLFGGDRPYAPDYWSGSIKQVAPEASSETVNSLANYIYRNSIEEQAAIKAEMRDYGLTNWRDYSNRFSLFTPEELEAAEQSRILQNYYYGRGW
jgi:hypothetical protein